MFDVGYFAHVHVHVLLDEKRLGLHVFIVVAEVAAQIAVSGVHAKLVVVQAPAVLVNAFEIDFVVGGGGGGAAVCGRLILERIVRLASQMLVNILDMFEMLMLIFLLLLRVLLIVLLV